MFDFFDKCIGFIEVIFDYFLTVISSLIGFLGITSQAVSFPLSLVGAMPSIIGISMMSVIGISVVKLITGR